MELPRNITQVGETDRNCKIYVEDYVVSYMKQMNKFAEEREIAVALYGKMSVEQQVTYCFVYGACMVQSISREVRHLSQAQNQEVERLRKKYFPEQTFLGYQILNGEMIEGFRIYDQNSCRYVKGYACFFEKNDAMLAYMLETRREEAQPEKVEQDKYDMVRKRQEDRRQQFEERKQPKKKVVNEPAKEEDSKQYQFKFAPFVLVAGGCLIALMLWGNGNTLESVKGQLSVWVEGLTGSQLAAGENQRPEGPIIDGTEESREAVQAVMGTLVTEDKLADAILEENEKMAEGAEGTLISDASQPTGASQPSDGTQVITTPQPTDSSQTGVDSQSGVNIQPTATPQVTATPQPTPQITATPQPTPVPEVPTVQRPESYVIKSGDTLIAISRRIYGSDSYVPQICKLNNISNPDNIQIGQKILLP